MRRRHTPRRLFGFAYLGLLVVIGMPIQAVGASAADQLGDLITRAKDAVRDENLALALELLGEAILRLDQLESRPILIEEALKWDVAQLHLDRADSMRDASQIAYFANESIKFWRIYIQWRGSLDTNRVEIIQRNADSDRIQRAVRLMGNAFMRRENLEEHSVRDLFAEYLDMPSTFMSSKSIDLWINWLHRCPSWERVDDTSFQLLAERLERNQSACRQDWLDFYDYLAAWLMEQELSTPTRNRYTRRLNELGQALGVESG